MPELLNARDVEQKSFRKVPFGGYSTAEVEEFMGQIVEDLETYVVYLTDRERRILELQEAVKKYDEMQGTIKDAFILAQKSGQAIKDEAERQAGRSAAEAEVKRAEVLAGAEAKRAEILAEAEAKRMEIMKRHNDIEALVRARTEEAENIAEGIIASARASAARIFQEAEKARGEVERRLKNIEGEIGQRLAEANGHVNEIMTSARLEARRIVGRAPQEKEECIREVALLQLRKAAFLGEFREMLSRFGAEIEKASGKKETEADGDGAVSASAPPPFESPISSTPAPTKMSSEPEPSFFLETAPPASASLEAAPETSFPGRREPWEEEIPPYGDPRGHEPEKDAQRP
jgi:cell division initiation protein